MNVLLHIGTIVLANNQKINKKCICWDLLSATIQTTMPIFAVMKEQFLIVGLGLGKRYIRLWIQRQYF